MEIKTLRKGVTLAIHTTDQFKSAVLSLSVVTPLDEKAAEKALLAGLLASTTRDYPTTLEMNRALAKLYGAIITASVSKNGEAQVLRLELSALDDRFTLNEESVCRAGIRLLCSCLFRPNVTSEGFAAADVAREKRLLLERMDSEKDDKRTYAHNRLIEEMCRGEAYGLSKYGARERVAALTGKDVFDVWKDVLLHSPVQIAFVGSTPEETVIALMEEEFSRIEKEDLTEVRTEFVTESHEVRIVREQQPVKQGKLVIGYRAGMTYDMDNYPAIRLMTALFGGGTYSKLFANVREKMSLCYYCSARLISSKGILLVESGVETENTQKALDAIRRELDELRAGNFTDDTLAEAKLSLSDGLSGVTDSNLAMLHWMSSYCTGSEFFTPAQIVQMLQSVTREEVILAANMISEDTVYILESDKEAATDERA